MTEHRLPAPSPGELTAPERLSRDELQARQLERLRRTLRYAYEQVPFYRDAFDRAGVHPDDCKDLADLGKFPATTKQDLRDNYPFGMFAVPQERAAPAARLQRHHRQAHRGRLHPA